ncbi:serine hydrolase [Phenylobacterium sp.]|uniref:serine hydrolase domain-containing protein n=1 Tax=Phenylobacterium sp. TaxID=1871053 RepID=UPI002733966C|nr:serine hydrolase domain-containing protein [Phenylobacterium sp.]MDP3854102.1 serine hydrolase domain-containing protein [Phenylobacterium sp.]
MRGLLAILTMAAMLAPPAAAQTPDRAAAYDQLDPIFEKFAAERHVPGLVYGVVVDGKLAYVKAMGVQDTVAKRPVTADSVFRIASMSKNFTALAVLKLRDEGKLSLDAPAETLIPELRGLTYPTTDSPKIRVRDLLNHTGGFVTDDPWGDRQLPMGEADFSRFLKAGVPFSRPPAMAMEYSNFGYALAGRVVTNVARQPYDAYIERKILRPLGMTASVYDVAKIPAAHRAIGYRWEDEVWVEEPALGPGVFGAMGGLAVSANDYAKYIAWVLAAWPPRDGAEDAILKRSSVREIAQGSNFPAIVPRSDKADPAACDRARVYGMGMIVLADCVLGPHFTHSGGLPGYGSNVLFLPERGVGVFALANRTYAGASPYVRDAAVALVKSGAFPARPTPAGERLTAAAGIVAKIYAASDVMAARDGLAMNVLLDSDGAHRNAELARLKAELGACQPAQEVAAETAMSGAITYPCEKGRLRAQVLLAPTTPVSLQVYQLSVVR